MHRQKVEELGFEPGKCDYRAPGFMTTMPAQPPREGAVKTGGVLGIILQVQILSFRFGL